MLSWKATFNTIKSDPNFIINLCDKKSFHSNSRKRHCTEKKQDYFRNYMKGGGDLAMTGEGLLYRESLPPPLYSFRNNFHREISLYDHSFRGKSHYIASLPGEVSLWGNVLLYSQPFGRSRTLGECLTIQHRNHCEKGQSFLWSYVVNELN